MNWLSSSTAYGGSPVIKAMCGGLRGLLRDGGVAPTKQNKQPKPNNWDLTPIYDPDLQVESVCACNPAHGLQLFGAIQCNDSPAKSHQVGLEFYRPLNNLTRLQQCGQLHDVGQVLVDFFGVNRLTLTDPLRHLQPGNSLERNKSIFAHPGWHAVLALAASKHELVVLIIQQYG